MTGGDQRNCNALATQCVKGSQRRRKSTEKLVAVKEAKEARMTAIYGSNSEFFWLSMGSFHALSLGLSLEKTQGRSHQFVQMPDGREQRRWSQALLSGWKIYLRKSSLFTMSVVKHTKMLPREAMRFLPSGIFKTLTLALGHGPKQSAQGTRSPGSRCDSMTLSQIQKWIYVSTLFSQLWGFYFSWDVLIQF